MRLLGRKILPAFFLINLCLLGHTVLFAQSSPEQTKDIPQPELGPNDTIPVPAQIVEHEIVPAQTLPWVVVSVPYPPELLKRRQEWTRLRNAVYVTYPYA